MSLPGKSFSLQRKQESRNPQAAGDFRREKGEEGVVGEVGFMTILALLRICQLEPPVMALMSLL